MPGVPRVVAILEDDPARIAAMRACLDELLPGAAAAFFEDAMQMIAWLGRHLGDVVLISLDHDLPLRADRGRTVDCGTGRQVADYLASVPPICPVIVSRLALAPPIKPRLYSSAASFSKKFMLSPATPYAITVVYAESNT